MNMNPDLRATILAENIRVHAKEATIYNALHSEIFNAYEQRILRHQLDLVSHIITNIANKEALDIGCGTGNILLKLVDRGFQVTGVDISSKMLDMLPNMIDSATRLICTDIDSFLAACTDRFDLITLSSVLHHLPHYLESVSHALQLLRPQGVLFVTHEPVGLSANLPGHSRFTAQRLVSRLAWKAWLLQLHLSHIDPPDISYTFSDFHAGQGIRLQSLLDLLSTNHFRVIATNYYVAEKTAWASFLNNQVLRAAPNNFSLIAQRVT